MSEHTTVPQASPIAASEPDEEVTGEFAPLLPPQAANRERDRLTLVILAGGESGRSIPVDEGGLVFGRGRAAGLRFEDTGLSRRHARLFRHEGQWFIEDLGSTNGTWLGGRPLRGPTALREGDRLQAGKSVLLRVTFQDSTEQEAARQMYESAVRDPLCRVYNRRYLNERLEAEMAYALRHGTPLSVILIDVDHFKQVNDTKGHLAGDAVLRVLGTALKRMVRAEDLVARYGGEEFAIVTRGIDARNTMILAERIRRAIGNMAIPWESDRLRITVSIGVATLCEGRTYPDVETLLAAADEALYEAKRAGRDRCIGASGAPPSTPAAASCPR